MVITVLALLEGLVIDVDIVNCAKMREQVQFEFGKIGRNGRKEASKRFLG